MFEFYHAKKIRFRDVPRRLATFGLNATASGRRRMLFFKNRRLEEEEEENVPMGMFIGASYKRNPPATLQIKVKRYYKKKKNNNG